MEDIIKEFALQRRGLAFVIVLALLGAASGEVWGQPAIQPAPARPTAPRRDSLEPQPAPQLPADEDIPEIFDLGAGVGFAAGPESAWTTIGGYIDSAIIRSRVRFRFDAAYDNPVPDRNQFFYPEDGAGGLGDETRVDFQDIGVYFEHAFSNRISMFVELPTRFLNPEVNPNTAGFADMNAGFKYALWQSPCDVLTFQFRTCAPTGHARNRGLGVGFASLEPSLLYRRQMSDRLAFESEFRAWIPLGDNVVRSGPFLGETFSGEVLRYGLGLGYDLYQADGCGDCGGCGSCYTPASRLTSVIEVVGWTILDGFGTFTDGITSEVRDVSGDTIVNLKIGGRWTCGDSTMYVGWGHVITSEAWYRDILRAEYEVRF